MTEREMLEILVQKVTSMDERLAGVETGQKNLETGQKNLEAGQKNLEAGLKSTNETLDIVAAQVSKLTKDVSELKADVSELKEGQKHIEVVLEHDIKPKIEALFDGHKQHNDQLERIEKEVSRHDEFILRRIK